MAINNFNLLSIKSNIYYAADDSNDSGDSSYQFLEESTDIDYDKILNVCDTEWEKANNTLKENATDYSSNFPKLDFLAGSYIEMLEDSMLEILEISGKIKDSVHTFAEKHKNLDDDGQTWTGGGGGNINFNNGVDDDGNGGDNTVTGAEEEGSDGEQTEIPIVPPIEEDPEAPPTSEGDETLGKIEITDIVGLIETLKDMSDKNNKKLDQLLLDETFFEDIKEQLLQSPFLSDESKKSLENVDAKSIVESLFSILTGGSPTLYDMNPLNLGVVYSYLEEFAFRNGITVEVLLTDPKHADLLSTALNDFVAAYDYLAEILKGSATELQAELLRLIDGDNVASIEEGAINVLREYVNYIASESDISVEDLLTKPTYANILKDGCEEFQKTVLFMKTMSYFSEDKAQEIVGGILNGKNAAALGLSDDNLNSLKGEMEAVAKSNGTSLDNLLSDSEYADFVKDALMDSKNAKEVGYIYRNQESSVAQNVVKNLCAQVSSSETV